ncbi:MAG: apolipoprotein N-acyltransferase [Desulfomonile tiedjei]|nr:apolipoprotein N-acyltransferase [Desulfomonile tiedjei]
MILFGCAAASGLLLALSFPPSDLYALAWIAFVPFFHVIESEPRPKMVGAYGAVFGVIFFLLDLRWVYGTLVTHGHFPPGPAVAVYFGLVLFLALFPAFFGFLVALVRQSGIKPTTAAPFLWTGLEYLRGVLFTGFPWDLVGYSQAHTLSLMQVVDITGVYGVSFTVVLVAGAVWEVLGFAVTRESVPWRTVGSAAVALLVVLAYGNIRTGDFPPVGQLDRHTTLGVLQGNIAQALKWDPATRDHTFATYEKLGHTAVERGANFLVWPETSAPVLYGSHDLDWKRPGKISEQLGVPMLVGAPSLKMVDGETQYYNSAFLIDGAMIRYRYDKIHLVPFGEYMPLSWLLPLGPGIAARDADYSPGATMTVMHSGNCPPFSVLVCYEAIFPDLARQAVQNGARLLINITNDGWFGMSGAPYQHLNMAGVRAIENRVWLVRAANTGISAAFDPAGRLAGQLPLDEEGVFTVNVSVPANAGSFYCRFGDIFAWGCLGISVLMGMSLLYSRFSDGAGRMHVPPPPVGPARCR